MLGAPGAFLTVGLCAPSLLLAAVAAANPSAPFGESHPCGSISVGTPRSPNAILQTLESTLPAALREAILVGQGLSFFVPPLAMLGLVLIGAASFGQRALGNWSALPLILALLVAGPGLPALLPDRAGFWMANSGYGPALWLAPLFSGFASLGCLLFSPNHRPPANRPTTWSVSSRRGGFCLGGSCGGAPARPGLAEA